MMQELLLDMSRLRMIAGRLADATGARRVVLFGSTARSEDTRMRQSDIDLIYVVPDNADIADIVVLAERAERALWPRRQAFDLVPMRQSHWRQQRSTLARQATKEGIPLYVAR